MRDSDLWKITALCLVGVVTGCSNPAADKPVAAVTEAAEISEAAPAGDQEGDAPGNPETEGIVVPFSGETSTIGFVGSKIIGGSHDGGFKTFAGSFTIDPANKTVSGVDAKIDMNSTWSDNEKLTSHLKNKDFFEVETYPEARFISTAVKPSATEGATHEVTGNFTLHGVTKSITFPATIAVTDEAVTLDSQFVIKRGDFQIVYGNVGDNAIRDEVVIKLALKGIREGESETEPKPEG